MKPTRLLLIALLARECFRMDNKPTGKARITSLKLDAGGTVVGLLAIITSALLGVAALLWISENGAVTLGLKTITEDWME